MNDRSFDASVVPSPPVADLLPEVRTGSAEERANPEGDQGDVSGGPARLKGTPIRHGELMPHAKPHCRWCNGRGEVVRFVRTYRPDGKEIPARKGETTKEAKICGCALKRFLKLNFDKVFITPQRQLCWRDGFAPPTAAP